MTPERCAELLQELLQRKLDSRDSTVTASEIRAYLSSRKEEGGKGGGVPDTAQNKAERTPVSVSSTAGSSNTSDCTSLSSARATQDVRVVLQHWYFLTLGSKENYKWVQSEKECLVVAKCLDHGLTPSQCMDYLEQVCAKPELINRRRPPSIGTAFRSVKQVCKVLGVKYEPPNETWLTSFDLVWQKHYGAPIPFGIAAKVLKPLVTKYGELEVQRRLDIYCAATAASYVSLPKFAATWGSWSAAPVKAGNQYRPGADMLPDWIG